jgi:hypothetical protein
MNVFRQGQCQFLMQPELCSNKRYRVRIKYRIGFRGIYTNVLYNLLAHFALYCYKPEQVFGVALNNKLYSGVAKVANAIKQYYFFIFW